MPYRMWRLASSACPSNLPLRERFRQSKREATCMSLILRPTAHRQLRTMMLLVSLCFPAGYRPVRLAISHGGLVADLLVRAVSPWASETASCCRLRGRNVREGWSDLSWLVLGLILAGALPLLVPLWMIALAVCRVALCKHGGGSLGRNHLNPAMVRLGIIAICFYQATLPCAFELCPLDSHPGRQGGSSTTVAAGATP